MKRPPETRRRRRPHEIDPFLSYLDEQVKLGRTIDAIEGSIREKGYRGSYRAIRNHVSDVRRQHSDRKERFLSRKHVYHLYWKPLVDLTEKKRHLLNQVLTLYPETKEIYGFVQLYRDMIRTKDKEIFHYILRMGDTVSRPELNSFIKQMKKEKSSIKAALVYSYSNAVLEGQVTRLKMIKRQLYGRASVEFLKNGYSINFEKRNLEVLN